jgi:hypothetical protein
MRVDTLSVSTFVARGMITEVVLSFFVFYVFLVFRNPHPGVMSENRVFSMRSCKRIYVSLPNRQGGRNVRIIMGY